MHISGSFALTHIISLYPSRCRWHSIYRAARMFGYAYRCVPSSFSSFTAFISLRASITRQFCWPCRGHIPPSRHAAYGGAIIRDFACFRCWATERRSPRPPPMACLSYSRHYYALHLDYFYMRYFAARKVRQSGVESTISIITARCARLRRWFR